MHLHHMPFAPSEGDGIGQYGSCEGEKPEWLISLGKSLEKTIDQVVMGFFRNSAKKNFSSLGKGDGAGTEKTPGSGPMSLITVGREPGVLERQMFREK